MNTPLKTYIGFNPEVRAKNVDLLHAYPTRRGSASAFRFLFSCYFFHGGDFGLLELLHLLLKKPKS